MKKTILALILFLLVAIMVIAPTPVLATFPFDSPNFLPPPCRIGLKFDKLDLGNYPILIHTTFVDVVDGTWNLDIQQDGTFSKTVSQVANNYSPERFAPGTPPLTGVFTLTGVYSKGQISGQWTYALNIPPRTDWPHPETFSGSGTFYTFDVITETSGSGVIEGGMTRSKTNWKNSDMKETVDATTSETIRNTWVATSNCTNGICGCWEYPAPQDSLCRFNSLTGEVGYVHCNTAEITQEWIPALPKTKLLVGDHISTGQDSSCILNFADMTTFQMKPESEVIVQSPPAQETKMGLVAGHLWINFKKMVTNGTMEVEMGQAVAGIKGTTLVLEQANGVSTLKVIEGTVAFTSKATGQTIDVNAGQTVSANFTGLTPVTNFDVTQESATWKTLAVAQKSQSSSVSSMMIIIIAAAVVVIVAVVVFILVKRKNKKEPAKE